MDRPHSPSPLPDTGLDASVTSLASSESVQMWESSRSPSPSASSSTLILDLASGFKSFSSSLELSDKLSFLVHQANDVVIRTPENDVTQDNIPLPTLEDVATDIRGLTTVVGLNNEALKVVGQLAKVQTEVNDRIFSLEHVVSDVRAQSQTSGNSARRLLYRTREHVRKERDALRSEGHLVTIAHDELADQVRNLGAELARMSNENARILAILQSRTSSTQRLQWLFRQVVWVYAPWALASFISAMRAAGDGLWRAVCGTAFR